MMRGASGDECGNLVWGQEYNRPAEAGVLKKPRGSDFLPYLFLSLSNYRQVLFDARVTFLKNIALIEYKIPA
jgi:hypothetical protein